MTPTNNTWCQHFYFHSTLNRLFNYCIKLYWYWSPSSQKTTLKKASLIRVNTLLSKFLSVVWFTVSDFLLKSKNIPKAYHFQSKPSHKQFIRCINIYLVECENCKPNWFLFSSTLLWNLLYIIPSNVLNEVNSLKRFKQFEMSTLIVQIIFHITKIWTWHWHELRLNATNHSKWHELQIMRWMFWIDVASVDVMNLRLINLFFGI